MESTVFVVPPDGHSGILHVLQQYGALDGIESGLAEAGRCVLFMMRFLTNIRKGRSLYIGSISWPFNCLWGAMLGVGSTEQEAFRKAGIELIGAIFNAPYEEVSCALARNNIAFV